MKSEFDNLFSLYETRLCLLKNPICEKCDAKVRNPLAVWHVGAKYRTSEIRLLFVGKPHRGQPGIIRPSGVLDPREKVKELRHMTWPYWSYTVEISKLIFGTPDKGWDRIAFTNLVKCTNVRGADASADQTTELMVRSCALDLGVISAEIEMLQPAHIVFYTGRLFPEVLKTLKIEGKTNWQ